MRTKKKRHPVRRTICALLILMLCAALAVGIFYGVKGYRMYQDAVSQVSIQDRVEEIREAEHFTKYSEMTEFYINAVISIEDHRFREHMGIDPIAVCRALWADIRAMSFKEGGSTITQQLAKNLLFTQEKSIVRKAAEVFAVMEIESEYSKEEIFELYVNTAAFGSGYEGIYAGAVGYFGKIPSELTDYESAVLAGVPNAPSVYAPGMNDGLASQRTRQVLRSMVRNQMITQSEMDNMF
ncbi:MAG: transglycosylase domain-containing protein [Dorea sp.]|nr:transglycosylase domain-containing protein [Dorea sp.]